MGGTGILNNELYIGRLVWNRLRYVKDPDTGKRLSRLNPPEAWIVIDAPHLRIVDDELWQAVKARQKATRQTMRAGVDRARRPKYLFSGLTRCAECGGGYILSSHDYLICFNARFAWHLQEPPKHPAPGSGGTRPARQLWWAAV